MPLSDIVQITIVTETAGVTQAGFGVPMILSADAAFPERIRFYTSITAVADDFDSDSPTYGMAAAIFSQNPKVERIAVGRMVDKPTQSWLILLGSAGPLSETLYQIQVNDDLVQTTSDIDATNDEIIDALVSGINTLAVGLTATAAGSPGSKYIDMETDDPGAWFQIICLNPDSLPDNGTYLTMEQDTADNGVSDELDAIEAVDSTWYAVCSPFSSEAFATEVADWVEARKKIYVAAVHDSATITAAVGGGDFADSFATAGYARTALIYTPDNGDFADAAWLGKCLPFDPGSETWKFKTLATVSAVSLTPTHQVNLEAKSCNYYYEVAGINITTQGVVSAGEFIDVIRFRDWLEARISERIFGRLANAKKIPYTDRGIAIIEAEVRAQLREGVDVGGLAEDPSPTVTVPKAADANPNDKAARLLRNVLFTATLAGAIHKLTIQGTLTL